MATSIDQKGFVKTALRLPPELHAAVHEAAQASGRSYNAELVDRVQRTIAEDAQAASKHTLDTGLMGVQTMLAFHLREFYDLLPTEAKKKPVNVAVNKLAAAIGHGSTEAIEGTLRSYFASGEESSWFRAIAHEIHQRREQLDAEIAQAPSKDPTPIEVTIDHLKAKP